MFRCQPCGHDCHTEQHALVGLQVYVLFFCQYATKVSSQRILGPDIIFVNTGTD